MLGSGNYSARAVPHVPAQGILVWRVSWPEQLLIAVIPERLIGWQLFSLLRARESILRMILMPM